LNDFHVFVDLIILHYITYLYAKYTQ